MMVLEINDSHAHKWTVGNGILERRDWRYKNYIKHNNKKMNADKNIRMEDN